MHLWKDLTLQNNNKGLKIKNREMNLTELSTQELKEIDGGKNLLEYIAQGLGYLVGSFVHGAEGTAPAGTALQAQHDFVHNSGGLKY